MEIQTMRELSHTELLGETLRLKNEGYRLAAISCTAKNGIELSYSFDRSYELLNLRLYLEDDAELDSISSIYPFAFLYENEIKELFGVNIKNIVPDFKDTLYTIAEKTPFQVKKEDA